MRLFKQKHFSSIIPILLLSFIIWGNYSLLYSSLACGSQVNQHLFAYNNVDNDEAQNDHMHPFSTGENCYTLLPDLEDPPKINALLFHHQIFSTNTVQFKSIDFPLSFLPKNIVNKSPELISSQISSPLLI